jgi:hypothetical protein
MTKAELYALQLRCVLGRKAACRDAELLLRRDQGQEFRPRGVLSGLGTRSTAPWAVVGDGGGLLVEAGSELDADKVGDLIAWLKETFIDDTEEARQGQRVACGVAEEEARTSTQAA